MGPLGVPGGVASKGASNSFHLAKALVRIAKPLVAVAVLCLAWSTPVRALDPSLKITQYAHDTWQQRDGLPSTVIQAIAQTPDGYLWLGTPTGLVRFDGVHFVPVPTVPDDPNRKEYIVCLVVAPDGALWIGTRYAGLRRITSAGAEVVKLPLVDQGTRGLQFDATGTLYVGTMNGLFRVDAKGEATRCVTRESYISSVSRTSDGRIWVGFQGYQSGVEFIGPTGLVPILNESAMVVNDVAIDGAGRTWIATSDALALWADGEITRWMTGNGTPYQRISKLLRDADGTLWVGGEAGLSRIVPGRPRDAAPENLPIGEITALCEDREGSLWIGTHDGLHRIKNVNAIPWGRREGLPSDSIPSVVAGADGSVYLMTTSPSGVLQMTNGIPTWYDSVIDGPSYLAKDGSLWVGTVARLSQLKNGQIRHFGTAEGLLKPWIAAVCEDEQGLLMSYSNLVGLRRWNGRETTCYRLRDGSEFTAPFHILSMLRSANDVVWAAGYDGLWRLDHGEITRYTTAVGVESSHTWYEEHPQSAQYFHTVLPPGMNSYVVESLAEDSTGTLWAATQRGGLLRVRDGVFTSFTTKEGLRTNQLSSVLVDQAGDLWMSSPDGILHVLRRDLDAVMEKRAATFPCAVFTRDDGLRNNECVNAYYPTAAKSRDGRLWFSTRDGVVSIDPAKLRRNDLPPPVHIEQVLVDGRAANLRAPLVLDPDTQKVEFRFTALSLLAPDRVRFRYQLVGYDNAWVDAGTTRLTQYTRLSPGEYTFRVIACNNDGVWNETGATFRFSLQPHFYHTFWFAGLCIVGAVGAGLGLHRWRVHDFRMREVELQRRVAERTVELSQANNDLQREVLERERAQQELNRVHRDLVTASHQAGMAEVATGVLHNVGNALNSVNVSTDIITRTVSGSKLPSLRRIVEMLRAHRSDLAAYLTSDPKGRQIPEFLDQLCSVAAGEHELLGREVQDLRKSVEHIREIVAMQQEYAKIGGLAELVRTSSLVEDAIRINAAALDRLGVQVVRDFGPDAPEVRMHKHKALQILVNFIQNAGHACAASDRADKQITIRIRREQERVRIDVADNGVGIAAELRNKIFTYGFTTRKDGHGFGLHTGAIAAKEMGGQVLVESDGPGLGATFTLCLPAKLDDESSVETAASVRRS